MRCGGLQLVSLALQQAAALRAGGLMAPRTPTAA
jgi:hypothetical protein